MLISKNTIRVDEVAGTFPTFAEAQPVALRLAKERNTFVGILVGTARIAFCTPDGATCRLTRSIKIGKGVGV